MRSTIVLGTCLSLLAAASAESIPHLNVDGRVFVAISGDVTGLSVRPRGTQTLVPVTVVAIGAPTNVLALTNTAGLRNLANVQPGVYDRLVLSLDPATMHLVEAETGAVVPMRTDPPGSITVDLTPALRIEAGSETLILASWMAAEDTTGNGYELSPAVRAATTERGLSGPFRTLPGRVVSANAVSGEIRVRLHQQDMVTYRVSINGVPLSDQHGTAILPQSLGVDERLLITGHFDSNADIVAEAITVLR